MLEGIPGAGEERNHNNCDRGLGRRAGEEGGLGVTEKEVVGVGAREKEVLDVLGNAGVKEEGRVFGEAEVEEKEGEVVGCKHFRSST